MNCPKCGHAQEERLDCLKCGIVFSKYSELHFPEKTQRPEPPPFPARNIVMHASEELSPGEVAELRQTVRELNRRFSELEFERADRNQLWKELRSLDQKTNAALKESSLRLDDCEARMQSIPETPLDLLKEQLWEEDLKPLLEKIEELEAGVEKITAEHAAHASTRTAETLGRVESRVAEVERALVAAASRNGEAGGGDTGKLRSDLEALRARQEAFSPEKLDQLRTEFLNLRAEIRQSFEQFAAVESKRSAQESGAAREEISSLADRLSVVSAEVQSLAEEISTTAALVQEARPAAGDSASRLQGIETAVTELEAESGQFRTRLASLEQQLGSRKSPPGNQPLREDVHSIRDNLDQIRDFMNTLARKL